VAWLQHGTHANKSLTANTCSLVGRVPARPAINENRGLQFHSTREDLRLAHPEGGYLRLTLSSAGNSPDSIIYVHGFGSRRQGQKSRSLEEECSRRGWTFAAMDFRAHGESSGQMIDLRASGLQADLDALAEFLRERGINRLFLVGSSLGGFASAWFTLRRPDLVGACVFLAPALDFLRTRRDRLTPEEQESWRRTGRMHFCNEWLETEIGYGLIEEIDRFPLTRLEREWSKPALLIHGMKDDVIPHAGSLDFLQKTTAAGLELLLLKDAGHRLTGFETHIARLACDFFERWK